MNSKDKVAPSYISSLSPKYLEIDNSFYGGLIVIDYYREYSDIILKNIIASNVNLNISIFYEKLDTYKTIRDLTYYIGNIGVELKTGKQNREDVDIMSYSYSDAKYIRKEMQVNNQDLYYLYIYIDVYADSEKELEYTLNKVEGIAQAYGIITRRANFRQEQVYQACLPIMENKIEIKNASKRNVLTDGLIATYPFISSSIFDENGIFLGTNIYNESLILIDRFNKDKYKNANMCIFGTSGAGKSFFTKLLIFRYRMIGIEQYVIDPEREYNKLCQNLNGLLIKLGPSSKTYVNVLDIREESIEEESGYLQTKLSKLKGFFKLVFGEMDEEEWAILEEKLIDTYKLKDITFDDESLYVKDSKKFIINPVFKNTSQMPILEDLYNCLISDERSKKMAVKLKPFINGSLSFLNNYTNVKLNNNLIVADIYELGEENIKYGMYLFTELFWDKIKKDRNSKKAIYMDEIWRMIGITSNKDVASFIYKIFKTIRKYGGSSVAITQDISDLFSLDSGSFGKSILNNSSIKSFFSLEEENILTLEKYTNISEKERVEIKTLKKGESLMFVGDNHILVRVEASDEEIEIIEGSKE